MRTNPTKAPGSGISNRRQRRMERQQMQQTTGAAPDEQLPGQSGVDFAMSQLANQLHPVGS